MANLKDQINAGMPAAMRAGDKARLATIRLMLSAIKQVEVDTRKVPDDQAVLAILDKMRKQRHESIRQFEQAGRNDLAAKEKSELAIISEYLPAALPAAKISRLIDQAMTRTGASRRQDMGAVMALLKPQLQGRADIGQVSQLVKSKLSG